MIILLVLYFHHLLLRVGEYFLYLEDKKWTYAHKKKIIINKKLIKN